MDPAEAVATLGGLASRRRLLDMTSRRALRQAVDRGDLTRVTRSEYRLPDLDRATTRAAELRGKVAVLSAAVAHGWEVPEPPSLPWVMLDHRSHAPHRPRAHVVWGDLTDENGLVTSPRRTVVDCARRLPFGTALAVADSALRHGLDADDLSRDASAVAGKGAAAARRVAGHADGRAANVFESLVRACAVEAGLDVRAQAAIEVDPLDLATGPRVVHPDVVDRGRRIAIEADSWEFHSGKEAFQRDCWRYTVLVVNGWTVVRFTWWQVRHHPDWVVAVLRRLVVGGDRRRSAA